MKMVFPVVLMILRMSQISQIKKIYHAAIYVRLSKEDGAVASHEKAESNSIANQKSLIREFLKSKNDIVIEQEYVDDGFSGSNFERPAFQMMLEDIKKGKIDCVVTKDLSRFGREYIDSGMYIERLFPAMGVRFIAINDGCSSCFAAFRIRSIHSDMFGPNTDAQRL